MKKVKKSKPTKGRIGARKTSKKTVKKTVKKSPPRKRVRAKKTAPKAVRVRRGRSTAAKRKLQKPARKRARGPIRRAAASPAVTPRIERELSRLRNVRSRLERRLTALVQEIGLLRQFEIRTRILEGEVQKRDQELAALRRQQAEKESGVRLE